MSPDMAHFLPRLFLVFAGLALIAFGIWFLLDPLGGAARLGLTITGDNAAFEVRGIYGGVSLALGALGFAGAIRTLFTRSALWVMAGYFGGYTLARAYSLGIGEWPTGRFISYAIFEAVMFVLAAASLALSRRP